MNEEWHGTMKSIREKFSIKINIVLGNFLAAHRNSLDGCDALIKEIIRHRLGCDLSVRSGLLWMAVKSKRRIWTRQTRDKVLIMARRTERLVHVR